MLYKFSINRFSYFSTTPISQEALLRSNLLLQETGSSTKCTIKRKYPRPIISPDRDSEPSSSASVLSCPEAAAASYSLSDRPEADQYLDDQRLDLEYETTTKQDFDEGEKYFLPSEALGSSSEDLSFSVDFSEDASLLNDKDSRKSSEESTTSSLYRSRQVPNNDGSRLLTTDTSHPLDSKRKTSVTFCEQRNQTVLLVNSEKYSKAGTCKNDGKPRKLGTYGKQRYSPNLFRNPYGPPLYQHNRNINTTPEGDDMKNLVVQQALKLEKKPKSSIFEGAMRGVTSGSSDGHSSSKMNDPIRKYLNNNSTLYDIEKMGKNLDNSVASLSQHPEYTNPSSTSKENYPQNQPSNVQSFEMNVDKSEETIRPAQKRSDAMRSRRNQSLGRSEVPSDPEHRSPRNYVAVPRSHSSSRKELKGVNNLDGGRKTNHVQSNEDRLRFVM